MSASFESPFSIRAPGTSANLGPGFDCIGVALDIWNVTRFLPGDGNSTIAGEGSEFLPTNGDNLILKSARKGFAAFGFEPPPMTFECVNEIPCARGIGSSSAAVATGVAAAMHIIGHDLAEPQARQQLFNLAAEIESHPDNVGPAVFGSCQIGYHTTEANGWHSETINLPENLRAVLYVPDFLMHTDKARGILPSEVARADAVFNVSRASLLTYALMTGELHLLKHATEDRLHQPHRVAEMFPRYNVIARAATDAGALGVFLSGAGPTILALATERHMTISYEMAEAARKADIPGSPRVVALARSGLEVAAG